MTIHDKDKIIAAAKEAGCTFPLRSGLGDCRVPQFFSVDGLERLYAIAFEAGRQAERKERDELKSLLKEGATGFGRVLISTSDDAAVRDWQKRANAALAKVRKP